MTPTPIEFHANQRLSFQVDPREGYVDLLISAALVVEAEPHGPPRRAIGRLRGEGL